MVNIMPRGINAKNTIALFKPNADLLSKPAAVLVHMAHCANTVFVKIKKLKTILIVFK